MKAVSKDAYHSEELTAPEKLLRIPGFILHFLVDYDQSFTH